MLPKTNISYPPMHTIICAYQGVRNNSFLEDFACVLNEWSLVFNRAELRDCKVSELTTREDKKLDAEL